MRTSETLLFADGWLDVMWSDTLYGNGFLSTSCTNPLPLELMSLTLL